MKNLILALFIGGCTVGDTETYEQQEARTCSVEYTACETSDGLAGYCSTEEQGQHCYPQCDLVSCTNFQFVWPNGLDNPGICYCMHEGTVVEQ